MSAKKFDQRGMQDVVDGLSDRSKQKLVDDVLSRTHEEPRVAEAVILAHAHHYGVCPDCGSELAIVRLPDVTRPDTLDAEGIPMRKGLLRCSCGNHGLILNPEGGIKP